MVGEKYRPPGHSVAAKYWNDRSSVPRYNTTDVPFAAYPNLWVSADIDVTPGRRIRCFSRARSRYVFIAMRMLSVPPEVTVPHTSRFGSNAWAASAPSIAAVIDTISASYFVALGHRSAWSGLTWDVRAYTR